MYCNKLNRLQAERSKRHYYLPWFWMVCNRLTLFAGAEQHEDSALISLGLHRQGNVDDKKSDAIYCLNDLVGYNIWSNKAINEIRKRGIPTIAGNYDQGIGLMSDECGCAYRVIRKACPSISGTIL